MRTLSRLEQLAHTGRVDETQCIDEGKKTLPSALKKDCMKIENKAEAAIIYYLGVVDVEYSN